MTNVYTKNRLQVRDRTCMSCGYEWVQCVELSTHTANLSGEASAWCPECSSRGISSSPMRDIRKDEIVRRVYKS